MKRIVVVLLLFLLFTASKAQNSCKWMPYTRQSGMYFASDHVTSMGVGLGLGLAMIYKQKIIAQTDMNIYWLNGNAFKNSISIGYKRTGRWSPAVLADLTLLWGSHTEVLFDDGSRPDPVVEIVGLKLIPLHFENDKGFVSMLECSGGIGRYHGLYGEVTLISIGIRL